MGRDNRRIKLVIPGDPLGKQRVKPSSRGGHIHLFTPSQTVNWESVVRIAFMEKYPDFIPFPSGTPMDSSIYSYFRIPSGFKKSERAEALAGILRPTKKPDCDNIIKISWDALNGRAHMDDCQFVNNPGGGKYYSERPRVEIEIWRWYPPEYL